SGAAWKSQPYWGLYATTKAGLDALVTTYAAETETTAVRVNLLSPGPVRTRLRAAAKPSEDPGTLPAPDTVAPAVLELTSSDFQETGRLFDLKSGRLMAFQPPVAVQVS